MTNIETGDAGVRNGARESRFTPCTATRSLLEETTAAVNGYRLSRACSSFDQFRYHQDIVEAHGNMVKTTGGGAPVAHPNIDGELRTMRWPTGIQMKNLIRVFLRENPGANNRTNSTSMKGRDSRQDHE